MTRTVLLLAYFFPPLGGAGVQRTLKFARYLPEYGYRPVVVTTRSRHYPASDPTLLAELPGDVPVLRARDPAILRWATLGFDYLDLAGPRAVVSWADGAAAWIPAATALALRAVRRYRPPVILSSAPPFAAHLAAWTTARLTGLPWVADFRDEFSANPHAEGRTTLIDRLNRRTERRVIADAAGVVTVADYFMIEQAPPGSPRRVTIVNGVDEADLPRHAAPPPSDRFRLSFVGTLYGDRDLGAVVASLRRLAAAGTIDPDRCELRIVGSMWLRDAPDAGRVPVVATGYLDHAAALREMGSATVLLFYAPGSSPAPSGKIFEYLASERPVLCVARRDNLASRLVEEWSAGLTAEPDAPRDVDAAITELYRRWEGGDLPIPSGARRRVLERYSRRTLTGELAAALDSAIELGPPARASGRPARRR
jgi:glycosyltransferase involved in cell wall biosynthesis